MRAQNRADEPPMILLGEYFFQQVTAGQTAQLQVRLPQDGIYLLTSDDLKSASLFTLTLFDESGRELYSDLFEPLELELKAARYMLQFQMQEREDGGDAGDASGQDASKKSSAMDAALNPSADSAPQSPLESTTDQALLSFVMLGNLGEMSREEDAPGQLYNGGFYRATGVDGPRYGVLSVPASPYPQEVNLSMAPASGDEYFVLAQGDDIDAVSIDTTKTTLLRFWTQGGDYALRVLPVGPASEFTLVPFLSGPPPVLPLEEAEQGVLPANTTRVIYQVVLDEFYGKLALTLDTNATNIRMKVTQKEKDEPLFTTSFGASELTLADLEAGVYYVTIESITPGETDVAYVLRAEGVAGASIGTLESGTVTTATLKTDGRAHLYEFPVTQAGAVITATLTGDAESGLGLVIGAAASENIWRSTDIGPRTASSATAFSATASSATASSATASSATVSSTTVSSTTVSSTTAPITTLETVFIAPTPGTYLAEVSGRGSGEIGASFALEVHEGPPAPALTPGEATWGRVEPGRRALYRLQLNEPDRLLTLLLVASAATDPALHVTAYDASGTAVYTTHSATRGASEAISRAAAPVGLYEVAVDGGETGGHYFLLPRLEAPATLATQWALSTVIEDPAASAVLGAPNAESTIGSDPAPDIETSRAENMAATWSPPADGVISLVLTYAHPVTPSAVTVYTDAGVGAVVGVEAYDAEAQNWARLWNESADNENAAAKVRTLPLADVEFATDQIRLLIDTGIAIPAIDAVALIGLP